MNLPSDLLQNGPTRLRMLEPNDVDLVLNWENNPEHWSVTGNVTPFSRATLEALCLGHQDIYSAGQLRWIIENEGQRTGAVDIYDFDARNLRAGIGILVEPEARRQGIASRALAIALRHATHGLMMRSVHAEIHAEHSSSLALFESAGFHRTGRYEDWTRTPTGWRDVILLQLMLNPLS